LLGGSEGMGEGYLTDEGLVALMADSCTLSHFRDLFSRRSLGNLSQITRKLCAFWIPLTLKAKCLSVDDPMHKAVRKFAKIIWTLGCIVIWIGRMCFYRILSLQVLVDEKLSVQLLFRSLLLLLLV